MPAWQVCGRPVWFPEAPRQQLLCERFGNPSQYEDNWQSVMPHLHKGSFSFWTSLRLSEAIRRQVILAKPGTQSWPDLEHNPGLQAKQTIQAKHAGSWVPWLPTLQTCRLHWPCWVAYRECSHCIIKSIIILVATQLCSKTHAWRLASGLTRKMPGKHDCRHWFTREDG